MCHNRGIFAKLYIRICVNHKEINVSHKIPEHFKKSKLILLKLIILKLKKGTTQINYSILFIKKSILVYFYISLLRIYIPQHL